MDLGLRTKRPHAVDNVNHLSAYITRMQIQFDNLRFLSPLDSWKAEERLVKRPIPKQLYYRRQTSGGIWSDEYTEENEVMDNIWEGVLTIDALKQLLSENLIRVPIITEDEINDKSKGDALSKGIALLQLTWFIVQIFTRAVQGLAVTKLELTTAALAGLNSAMYIFWWSKPHDVRFPVAIRTSGADGILAKSTEGNTWSVSDSEPEFDLRIHLWKSFTSSIDGMLDTFRSVVVYILNNVKSASLRHVKSVKEFPRNLALSCSWIYKLFVKPVGKAEDDKTAELKRKSADEAIVGPKHQSESHEVVHGHSTGTFKASTYTRVRNAFVLHCLRTYCFFSIV